MTMVIENVDSPPSSHVEGGNPGRGKEADRGGLLTGFHLLRAPRVQPR